MESIILAKTSKNLKLKPTKSTLINPFKNLRKHTFTMDKNLIDREDRFILKKLQAKMARTIFPQPGITRKDSRKKRNGLKRKSRSSRQPYASTILRELINNVPLKNFVNTLMARVSCDNPVTLSRRTFLKQLTVPFIPTIKHLLARTSWKPASANSKISATTTTPLQTKGI